MKNKEIKREMLSNGTYSTLRKVNSSLYREGNSIKGLIHQELINSVDTCDLCAVIGDDMAKKMAKEEIASRLNISLTELESFLQMQHAKKVKAKRMEQDIIKALSKGYGIIFATLTFRDEVLELTKRKRRQYVKTYLDQFEGYIANIDYGSNNGREHYHAIVFMKSEKLDPLETEIRKDKKKQFRHFIKQEQLPKWKYGVCSFEKEYKSIKKLKDNSPRKLSNYIAKINNHSLKVEQQRVLKSVENL